MNSERYDEKVAIARHRVVLEARIKRYGARFEDLWMHVRILEVVEDGMNGRVKKLNRRSPQGRPTENSTSPTLAPGTPP